MGSIWHIGVTVPGLQKGRKELGVFSLGSPAAVPFDVALAFEGVVNRFDPLADPVDRAVAGCLVAAGRAGRGGGAGRVPTPARGRPSNPRPATPFPPAGRGPARGPPMRAACAGSS